VIYLDVSSAIHAKAGLGRYSASLARELDACLGDNLCLFQNSLGSRGPLPGWDGRPVAGVRWGYRPWRFLVAARQLARLPMDSMLVDGQLFHATEHLLPYLTRVPTVLTVHDLIFEHHPEHHKFFNYRYLKAMMPLYCRRATAIIAVSETTKRDLLDCYGLGPEKITVVPEAAAGHFRPQSPERVSQVRKRYDLPERYALSVGTIEPRKNLSALVDACGGLFRDGLLDALVLVGGKGWLYEEFFLHLSRVPWRNRVLMPGYVPDADLPALYAGAVVTVQPSVYEGFGLPVLEAMACESPVCASRVSSLPEVGGGAARYFAPSDTEEMAAVIRRVVLDDEARAEMIEAGRARAQGYSWRATAQQTLRVYERAMRLPTGCLGSDALR